VRFFFGLRVAFFIINALSARYEAGADDANRVGALGKHNHHEPSIAF